MRMLKKHGIPLLVIIAVSMIVATLSIPMGLKIANGVVLGFMVGVATHFVENRINKRKRRKIQ